MCKCNEEKTVEIEDLDYMVTEELSIHTTPPTWEEIAGVLESFGWDSEELLCPKCKVLSCSNRRYQGKEDKRNPGFHYCMRLNNPVVHGDQSVSTKTVSFSKDFCCKYYVGKSQEEV